MAYKDIIKSFHPLNASDKKKKKSILKTKIQQVDFDKIRNVADLVDAYKGASIQARNVGECADIFQRMLKDKERPTIMLGLAGPLIAAGLRKVIRDLIHSFSDVRVVRFVAFRQLDPSAVAPAHIRRGIVFLLAFICACTGRPVPPERIEFHIPIGFPLKEQAE